LFTMISVSLFPCSQNNTVLDVIESEATVFQIGDLKFVLHGICKFVSLVTK